MLARELLAGTIALNLKEREKQPPPPNNALRIPLYIFPLYILLLYSEGCYGKGWWAGLIRD